MANQKPSPQQNPGDPGTVRKPSSPAKPTEHDPYQHPGDEPEVKPDVIADEGRPSKGGNRPGQRVPGNPSGSRPAGEEGK